MENDIDSDNNLAEHIHKLEKELARDRSRTNDLQKKLDNANGMVSNLQSRLTTLVRYFYCNFIQLYFMVFDFRKSNSKESTVCRTHLWRVWELYSNVTRKITIKKAITLFVEIISFCNKIDLYYGLFVIYDLQIILA